MGPFVFSFNWSMFCSIGPLPKPLPGVPGKTVRKGQEWSEEVLGPDWCLLLYPGNTWDSPSEDQHWESRILCGSLGVRQFSFWHPSLLQLSLGLGLGPSLLVCLVLCFSTGWLSHPWTFWRIRCGGETQGSLHPVKKVNNWQGVKH